MFRRPCTILKFQQNMSYHVHIPCLWRDCHIRRRRWWGGGWSYRPEAFVTAFQLWAVVSRVNTPTSSASFPISCLSYRGHSSSGDGLQLPVVCLHIFRCDLHSRATVAPTFVSTILPRENFWPCLWRQKRIYFEGKSGDLQSCFGRKKQLFFSV